MFATARLRPGPMQGWVIAERRRSPEQIRDQQDGYADATRGRSPAAESLPPKTVRPGPTQKQ